MTHQSSAGQQLMVLGCHHDNRYSITTIAVAGIVEAFVATPLLYHWLPQSASLLKIDFGNNFRNLKRFPGLLDVENQKSFQLHCNGHD